MSNIVVIGAGVVGQAVGKGFAQFGHRVVFCDTAEGVRERLIAEGFAALSPEDLGLAHEIETDYTMICVGTPTVAGRIDLGPLEMACHSASRVIQRAQGYHVVVVNSTLPPGTTQEFVIPKLEYWSGRQAGRDFGVCYNPEFLREVSAAEDFLNPWAIVIGVQDKQASSLVRELYSPITIGRPVSVFTTDFNTAEMAKYVSNLFNATKISFANEVWLQSNVLGIDGNAVMSIVSQTAEGCWNRNYGTKGGYPYGGSCLPKDTKAFESFAYDRGLSVNLLRATIEVNSRMVATDGQNGQSRTREEIISTTTEIPRHSTSH
jgi:UDPglucose 6-dehydrogenase